MAINRDFIVKNGLVVQGQGSAASTSTTTGAIVTPGGVGIGGSVNIAGGLVVSGVDFLAHDEHVWYVSDSDFASDSNDGARPQSSFRTIKHALSVANSGDTVFIEAGQYQEIFPLTIPQGVSVRGAGLRETYVYPTVATQANDAFLLNGETAISDFTVGGFYKPGWAFKWASGAKVTSKSPYIERFSVLTRGSTTTVDDPYGFAAGDAGNGALIDGSQVTADSQYSTFLFNEATFIVPNATGLEMTNGARTELMNGFFYFADKAIYTHAGTTGFAGAGRVKLRLGGMSGSFYPGDTLTYRTNTGTVLATATIGEVDNDYIYINGPQWGFVADVDANTSTQQIFVSAGTGSGTATNILLADYHEFGAEIRSIASAAVFGTQGVIADGTGTDLKLIAFNVSHIGAGGDISDDISLVNQAAEIIQINGGKVYFQTVDQNGDFRVGKTFFVNQRTGDVSFGTATISLASLPSLLVTDGLNNTVIQPTSITVGNLSLSGNNIQTTSGNLNINSAGPNVVIGDNTIVQGTFTATGLTNFTNNTNATSTTTGAVHVDGGLSVAKDTWLGGSLNVTQNGTSATIANLYITQSAYAPGGFIASTFTSTSLTITDLATLNRLIVTNNAQVNGVFTVTGQTTVSGITGNTGSFTTLYVTGSADSTSSTSGALQVDGGASIDKNLWVGGNTYLQGNLYVDGGQFIVTSTNTILADKVITLASTLTSAALAIDSGIIIGTGTGYVSMLFDGASSWKFKGSLLPNGTQNLGSLTNPWNILYGSTVYDNNNRVITSVVPTAGAGIGLNVTSASGPSMQFSITNTGVLSIIAGTDTNISTSTGNVTIWDVSTLQTVTGRGATTNQAINITNNTSAFSTFTGALKIAGGVGIGQRLYVKEAVFVNGAEAWTTATLTDNSQLTNGAGYLTSSTLGLFGVSAINAGVGIAVSSNTGSVTVTNIGVVSLTGTNYIGISASSGSNISITNLGVQTLTAGTDTAVSRSTGTVTVWNVSTLQTITSRGNTTNQALAITSTNLSVSTNSGQALMVSGGIGALSVYASSLYDNSNRVLTRVTPVGGTAISITAVSTANADTTFTINNTGVTSAVGSTYIGVSTATGNVVFTNLGVQTLTAGTDTAVSRSTGTVTVWGISTLQSVTGRGATTNQAINITNATQTTASTNGALVVAGGAGIGGNAVIGGNLTVLGTLNADVVVGSITTASNVFGGSAGAILYQTAPGNTDFIGIGEVDTFLRSNGFTATWQTTASMYVAKSVNADISTNLINGYISSASSLTVSGITTLTNTTAASNTTSGALQVAGGVGVGGAVYAGGGLFDRTQRVVTTVIPTAGTAIGIGNLVSGGTTASFAITNLGVQAAVGTTYIGVSASTGSVTFTNLGVQTLSAGTDTAVSRSTGTVTVWDISTLQSVTGRGATTPYSMSITSSTQSVSTATGALTVTGGIGLGGNINIGGSMNVRGPVTFSDYVSFNGTTTYVLSTNTIYTDNILDIHTTATGVQTLWPFDDGKDLGLRFHYYNRTLSTGTNAFLGLANDTQWLEWYGSGVETVGGIFTSSVYGKFKTGSIALADTTDASSVVTGVLTVAGGAGISKNLYVGNNIYSNGSLVITAASLGQYGVSQIIAGPAIGINPASGTGTVTITNLGVQTLTAGTDTVVSSNTGTITIWDVSTLQSVTSRGSSTNQIITLTNTAIGLNTNSGQTLLVTGGIGAQRVVAADIYDNSKRVITGLNITAGTGISVTGVTTSGPTGAFTINNTGVTSAVGTTYLGVSAATGAVTFTNLGVQTLTAGSGTAVSSNTGTVTVWSVDTLQLVTARGATTDQSVYISNATQSTSTATGALRVAGGAGVGGNVNIGGNLSVSGLITGLANVSGIITTASNVALGTAGALVYQSAIGKTDFIGIGAADSFLRSNGSTATWQTTASIYVNSAVYAEELKFGATGSIPYQSTGSTTEFIGIGPSDSFLRSNGSTATWQTTASIYVNSSVYAEEIRGGTAGQLLYQSAPSVTNYVGPGVAGQVLVSNGTAAPAYQSTLTLAGSTQATSTNTGALTVAGGAGIGGNLYIGGTLYATNVQGAITTATNIAGGSSGQVPYQTAVGATSFFGPGTAGNVLVSNGTGAPAYYNTLTLAGTVQATSTNTGALQVRGGMGVGGNIYAGGSLYAVTKSFLIDHPTKPGKKLRYGSLEGPENGVYVRGRLTGDNTIELPDYWTKLVDPESITVDLTPIGQHQKLYVKEIVNNTVVIGNENLFKKEINCFYTVWAERADVEKLDVEGE